jgi:hypothetical protein
MLVKFKILKLQTYSYSDGVKQYASEVLALFPTLASSVDQDLISVIQDEPFKNSTAG